MSFIFSAPSSLVTVTFTSIPLSSTSAAPSVVKAFLTASSEIVEITSTDTSVPFNSTSISPVAVTDGAILPVTTCSLATGC